MVLKVRCVYHLCYQAPSSGALGTCSHRHLYVTTFRLQGEVTRSVYCQESGDTTRIMILGQRYDITINLASAKCMNVNVSTNSAPTWDLWVTHSLNPVLGLTHPRVPMLEGFEEPLSFSHFCLTSACEESQPRTH